MLASPRLASPSQLEASVIAGLLVTAALAVCYPPPVSSPIAVPYVQPACTYCPGHRGVEYQLAERSPVRSVAPGVVTFAGVVAGTRYVVVLQSDGLRATYGRLHTSLVSRGDVVIGTQIVGSSSQRLYFGLRDATDQPVDPTPLLGSLVGRVRLVPTNGDTGRPPPAPRLACEASVSGVLSA